jgi:hypothetical protein
MLSTGMYVLVCVFSTSTTTKKYQRYIIKRIVGGTRLSSEISHTRTDFIAQLALDYQTKGRGIFSLPGVNIHSE